MFNILKERGRARGTRNKRGTVNQPLITTATREAAAETAQRLAIRMASTLRRPRAGKSVPVAPKNHGVPPIPERPLLVTAVGTRGPEEPRGPA